MNIGPGRFSATVSAPTFQRHRFSASCSPLIFLLKNWLFGVFNYGESEFGISFSLSLLVTGIGSQTGFENSKLEILGHIIYQSMCLVELITNL
jgi:hypothetical protein